MTSIVEFSDLLDPVLEHAQLAYQQCCARVEALVEAKVEVLSGYDGSGMVRAATICHWGRSGSVLLASYLDNHPDIIALPNQTSEYLYLFYRHYASLPLWQKLAAYPFYSASRKGSAGDFFLKNNPDGDYAIECADYFAGVIALERLYGKTLSGNSDNRAWFFRLVHLAYAAALERRAVNARPLMVSAQHWFSEELAASLNEDFPDAQFMHSIRDPISGFDSWLERHFIWQFGDSSGDSERYKSPSLDAYLNLLSWDIAHLGADYRTRAVRFEDLHLRPEETMRRLAAWLQVSFCPSMIESTLNGRPYVVSSAGISWVGANPKNARRRSGNLSAFDRWVLFALLRRNFSIWDYPKPKLTNSRVLSSLITLFGAWVPTRMEVRNARNNAVLQAGPALRAGRVLFGLSLPVALIKRRVRFALLILSQSAMRALGKRVPMKVI